MTLYTCEVAQSEVVGLLATRRRFSRHDRLRNACTQRVVQFEVADFTGAPLGGRFSVYGWEKKKTLAAPRTVVILNPISAGGRSTCENKGDDSTRYHCFAWCALRLNTTMNKEYICSLRRATQQQCHYLEFFFFSIFAT